MLLFSAIFLLPLYCSLEIPEHLLNILQKAHSLQDLMGKVEITRKGYVLKGSLTNRRKYSGRVGAPGLPPPGDEQAVTSMAIPGPEPEYTDAGIYAMADTSEMDMKQGKDHCELKTVCVPVTLEAENHQIRFSPMCHEAKRCVGSCCIDHSECRPTKVKRLTKQVYELEYVGNGIDELRRVHNITIDEHLSCSCECGSDAPICLGGHVLKEPECNVCECEKLDDSGNCPLPVIIETNEEIHAKTKQGSNSCSPETVCIPPNISDDHTVRPFPSCFEVKRCIGSCCNRYDGCYANNTRIIHKMVAELFYNGKGFEFNRTMTVPVVEHIDCACMSCNSDPVCKVDQYLGDDCECHWNK